MAGVVTPQPMIVGSYGGWAVAVQFTDASGHPIDLTQAGLTPVVEFYRGNVRRTTRCDLDVTSAASGAVVVLIPQDVVQSTLQPAPASVLLGSASAAPYPFRVIAYVIDSRGTASAQQSIAIQPIDWRTADFASIPTPQPLVAVVGPAGAPGKPGTAGAAGADGNSAPQSATAAGPIALHQVIFADPLGALPASSDQGTEAGRVMGVSLGAAALGQAVAYSTGGRLVDAAWNWKPGPIYLGLGGALTQTPPSAGFIQQIGRSDGPTAMIVDLGRPTVILLPGDVPALSGASYRDIDGGREVVRLATVETAVPDSLVGTGPDGFLSAKLLRAGSLSSGKLGGGPHLASLPNGAFEDGFDGWTASVTGSGMASVDPTVSAVGRNSAYLRCPAPGDTAAVASSLVPCGEGVPVYVATRALLRASGAVLTLAALFFDRRGAGLGPAVPVGSPIQAVRDFGEYGAYVVPPAGARYGAARVLLTGVAGGVGSVNIDEVMLHRQVGGPAAWQVLQALAPLLVAAGASLADFLAVAGQDVGGAGAGMPQPVGGPIYRAAYDYLHQTGAQDPALTQQLAGAWVAAVRAIPTATTSPAPSVASARTGLVVIAVKPVLAARGGTWTGFVNGYIGAPDDTDGSNEALNLLPDASIGGVLYGRLLAYLTDPLPKGLAQPRDQSIADLTAAWAAPPSIVS